MRKSAISTKSNKFYNPNSLEVTGDKITLLQPARLKTNHQKTKKTLKIDSLDQEELYSSKKPCQIHHTSQQPKIAYKKYLSTSVREYTNSDVSSKVLKQIRETSKVEDFERILQNLCQSDNFFTAAAGRRYINKRETVLEALESEDLYQEFFGKHFDYLESIVSGARAANQIS